MVLQPLSSQLSKRPWLCMILYFFACTKDLQENACARLEMLASTGQSGTPCCYVYGTGGGGHESGLSGGRKEDASETSLDRLSEEVGSKKH